MEDWQSDKKQAIEAFVMIGVCSRCLAKCEECGKEGVSLDIFCKGCQKKVKNALPGVAWWYH